LERSQSDVSQTRHTNDRGHDPDHDHEHSHACWDEAAAACATNLEEVGFCSTVSLPWQAPTPPKAWFKKCHFQVTPEIDRALMVEGFLVLGVTLI